MIDLKKIFISLYRIFLPLILGSIIGVIINSSMDYSSLVKPPLSPPSILFPIVWSIIYLLMGVSYYIYRKDYNDKDTVRLYYIQLVVNLLWSIIFFTLKLRLLSIIWIIILDILVIRLYNSFKKDKPISSYLNILYIIWILFATYLNIGIYILNK